MHDLALALVTIGGAGLLLDPVQLERDRVPFAAPSSRGLRPGAASASPSIPRTFDAVFARHGQDLPVAYLRALAWSESRLDPRATTRKSSATGLLQVVDVVRSDHNRLHGTAYTRKDLTDPVINVTVAAAALRRVVRSYARNHQAVPNLLEDWNNYRFVELLTNGWNAGWSERAGLGRVARYLAEQVGTNDITIDLVHQHARAAGATRHLYNPNRLRWAQKVARHYSDERARDAPRLALDVDVAADDPDVDDPDVDDAQPVSSPGQVS